MRTIRRLQPFCGLFLIFVLAGCSGSNEILDGSRGRAVTDEVSGALQLVVLGALEMLTAFSPVNQPAPPRAMSGDSRSEVCAHFDPLCRSGRYEVCRVSPSGAVVFRYDRCDRPSALLDGAWQLSQDGLFATAEFDLSLDRLELTGRIGYVLDDMCWRKEFDSFTAARHDYSAVLDGNVDYCFADGPGSGQLRVVVTGPTGPFGILLEFDAGRGSAVVSRGGVTTICRFDTQDGAATCEID